MNEDLNNILDESLLEHPSKRKPSYTGAGGADHLKTTFSGMSNVADSFSGSGSGTGKGKNGGANFGSIMGNVGAIGGLAVGVGKFIAGIRAKNEAERMELRANRFEERAKVSRANFDSANARATQPRFQALPYGRTTGTLV